MRSPRPWAAGRPDEERRECRENHAASPDRRRRRGLAEVAGFAGSDQVIDVVGAAFCHGIDVIDVQND